MAFHKSSVEAENARTKLQPLRSTELGSAALLIGPPKAIQNKSTALASTHGTLAPVRGFDAVGVGENGERISVNHAGNNRYRHKPRILSPSFSTSLGSSSSRKNATDVA